MAASPSGPRVCFFRLSKGRRGGIVAALPSIDSPGQVEKAPAALNGPLLPAACLLNGGDPAPSSKYGRVVAGEVPLARAARATPAGSSEAPRHAGLGALKMQDVPAAPRDCTATIYAKEPPLAAACDLRGGDVLAAVPPLCC